MYPKYCPTALLRFLSHRIWYSEKPNKTLVSSGRYPDLPVDREGKQGGEVAAPSTHSRQEVPCSAGSRTKRPLPPCSLKLDPMRHPGGWLVSAGYVVLDGALRCCHDGGLCNPPLLCAGLGGAYSCELFSHTIDCLVSVAIGFSLAAWMLHAFRGPLPHQCLCAARGTRSQEGGACNCLYSE